MSLTNNSPTHNLQHACKAHLQLAELSEVLSKFHPVLAAHAFPLGV